MFYLDKKEFLDLIVNYQELGEKMSRRNKDRLGILILSLVNHIAMKPNFSNYTYIDEMKSNAIITIWKGLNTFNPERTSEAFSYFTTTCFNAFIQIIEKEKITFERKQQIMLDTIESARVNDPYRFAKKRFTQEIKESNSMY
jgi:DNA-directed RNA polymerase specialized sigma subunit